MLTTLRIAHMIGALDEGHGVRISVSTLDEKCVYSHEMARDEAVEVQVALEGFGADCPHCASEEARAEVLLETLEITRDERDADCPRCSDLDSEADCDKCTRSARRLEKLSAAYEAEKLSHGETQRSLMTAICRAQEAEKELDAAEARVVLREEVAKRDAEALSKATLRAHSVTKERDALATELAELQAEEPVAYGVQFATGGWEGIYARESNANRASIFVGSRVVPLYAAPPKAETAFGVSDERFASVRTTPSGFAVFGSDFTGREVVSRDEANRINETPVVPGDVREVVRIVPVDATVVDVAAIRETCGTGLEWLSKYGKDGMDVRQFLERILAAIGEG